MVFLKSAHSEPSHAQLAAGRSLLRDSDAAPDLTELRRGREPGGAAVNPRELGSRACRSPPVVRSGS